MILFVFQMQVSFPYKDYFFQQATIYGSKFLKVPMSILTTFIESYSSKSNPDCSELHSDQAHLHFTIDHSTII